MIQSQSINDLDQIQLLVRSQHLELNATKLKFVQFAANHSEDEEPDKETKKIRKFKKKTSHNKQGNGKHGNGKKKEKVHYHCDFCDKDGHTESRCWFNKDCKYYRFCRKCKNEGHTEKLCKTKKKNWKTQVNIVDLDEKHTDSDSD